MRITEASGLHQLTCTKRVFPVNCYLVEETDGLILVDTCYPMQARRIVAAADSIGKPITTIVITHAHMDHVGSLDAIKALLPDAEVCIGKREAPLLKGDLSLTEAEPDQPIRGSVQTCKTEPDRLLSHGDRVGHLRVYDVPGHTPGSIALFDVRSRAAIVGDAMQTRGALAVAGVPVNSFPFIASATWDDQKAYESVKKIALLEPKLLACGHGDMMAMPGEGMKEALARAEKRQEAVTEEESVLEGSTTLYEGDE